MIALLLLVQGYDVLIDRIEYSAEATRVHGRVVEFPDATVLGLQLMPAPELFDWKTGAFAVSEPDVVLSHGPVTVADGKFTWEAKVPGPGTYFVRVVFEPVSQSDPAVARYMGREFFGMKFRIPVCVGRSRDVFRQVERDLKAIDDARGKLEGLLTQIEALAADRAALRADRKIGPVVTETRRGLDPAAESAVLNNSMTHLIALYTAVDTFVAGMPREDGEGFTPAVFGPSGEEIEPPRMRALLAEIESALARELALQAYLQARRPADEVDQLLREKPSAARVKSRAQALQQDLAAITDFAQKTARLAQAADAKDASLASTVEAVAAYVTAAEDALGGGATTPEQVDAAAQEARRRLSAVETKVRTGQDPKKE